MQTHLNSLEQNLDQLVIDEHAYKKYNILKLKDLFLIVLKMFIGR